MVAVLGGLDMSANIAVALALQLGPVGINSVLSSLYPVFTVIAAIVLLRERPDRRSNRRRRLRCGSHCGPRALTRGRRGRKIAPGVGSTERETSAATSEAAAIPSGTAAAAAFALKASTSPT